MVILENKKLLMPLLIAALLLTHYPSEVVEARSRARSTQSWVQIPRANLSMQPANRPLQNPSAIFLPPNSAPPGIPVPDTPKQFSRAFDWDKIKENPEFYSPQANRVPKGIVPAQLEPTNNGFSGPFPPVFQISGGIGPALSSETPITGALPQPLIPPTVAGSSAPAPRAGPSPGNEEVSLSTVLRLPKGSNQKIKSLELRDNDLRDALRVLAGLANINLMLANDISGTVNIQFADITIEEALNTLLKAYNLAFSWDGNILRIFLAANAPLSTVIFSIQNAAATAVKTIVDRMLTPNRGRCEVDQRLNAIMVTDSPNVIDTVRALLPQLDVREGTVEVSSRPITEVFYLDYVDATALTQPISMVAPTAVIQAFSSSSSQAGAGGGASGGRMDMMIITDTQNNLEKIRELIEKLDISPIQVTIDAHIYEIDLNEEERLGINWQKQIPIPGSTESSFDMTIAPEDSNAGGTGVFRFGSLNVNQFRALLAMLKSHTFAKVLSNPVITTLNNRQANITVGQAIPYISGSTVNAQTGQVTNTVNTANANITLLVTPSVTGNEEVFLNISPTISSVLGFSTLGGNATPNLSNRSAQTQVIVKNNHTIVIGGMIKTDKSDTNSKVPFLGDLPGIGKLFQKKTSKETRTELIIFITPHIVRSQNNKKPGTDAVNTSNPAQPRLSLQ